MKKLLIFLFVLLSSVNVDAKIDDLQLHQDDLIETYQTVIIGVTYLDFDVPVYVGDDESKPSYYHTVTEPQIHLESGRTLNSPSWHPLPTWVRAGEVVTAYIFTRRNGYLAACLINQQGDELWHLGAGRDPDFKYFEH